MDTFLTPRQLEILKLRHAGKTQREIAGRFGTTRENITIAEKRAKENVRKARKTLEEYERLAAIEIDLSRITDTVEIPRTIFKKGDQNNLKVMHSATDIMQQFKAYQKRQKKDADKVLLRESGKIEFK